MRKAALTAAIVMVVMTGVACSNGSPDGPESSADGTRPAPVEPAEQRDDARVLRELEAIRAALPADPSPPPTSGKYGHSVWRSYSEPGGIRDEVDAIVRAHPDRARSMVIGTSHLGQEIVAVRVSSDLSSAIGERPSVVHLAGQHAREWIGTEIDLRLLRLYLDGTDPDGALARQLRSTDLWFVPVANPDGYDYSFSTAPLWRKNLRDNDGDGQITEADGVDLNRNLPHRWGFDNEGSSPLPGAPTYRGPSPASEPETQALTGLLDQVRPTFLVNWHSASELLMYGVGSQVATSTPDDVISQALVGDDSAPAVVGFHPGRVGESYTTNGETTEDAAHEYGTLAFTAELDTCDAAEAFDDLDQVGPTYCEDHQALFGFPDDERLIGLEFSKVLVWALAIGESAVDPADPVSPVGRKVPAFVLDPFTIGSGTTQTVSVVARRSVAPVTMQYRINDGEWQRVAAKEWKGGERFGRDGTRHYAEYRASTAGIAAGDEVTVRFEAQDRSVTPSESFTYEVENDRPAQALVVANENYRGVDPPQPGVTEPVMADDYRSALEANGVSTDVWDVTERGVPDPLAVLAQYDLVVWETGASRLGADAEDETINVLGTEQPDAAVSETQQNLTLAVRSYLNEGGRLIYAGDHAGYFGALAAQLGGVYYAPLSDETAECTLVSRYDKCLIVSDDFAQYYLGVSDRSPVNAPTGIVGLDGTLDVPIQFGVPPVEAGAFRQTSAALPAAQFPLFASRILAEYPASGDGSGETPRAAIVATDRTLTMGFGLAAVGNADDRNRLVGALLTSIALSPRR